MSLTDSKYDTLNKFYIDFTKLNAVKSQNNETKQKNNCFIKEITLWWVG